MGLVPIPVKNPEIRISDLGKGKFRGITLRQYTPSLGPATPPPTNPAAEVNRVRNQT
jgi:hypothetical protein